MKFLNYTRIPDEVLRPVVVAAARNVGLRLSSGFLLEVRQARSSQHSGKANDYCWVRRRGPGRKTKRTYQCNAWARVTVGVLSMWGSPLSWAEGLFRIIAHELKHVLDYQMAPRSMDSFHDDATGKRLRWAERPHEIRAEDAAYDALAVAQQQKAGQDVILALAVWAEEAAA